MTKGSASFVGDIPAHYDAGLGPNIFTDYADAMVRKCGEETAGTVLELAAGTGILSRKLRDALPSGASLTVSDLNQPMLDVAKRKFADAEDVRFETVNAMELPFADGRFDLIACQFGVMFFPDKPASYREAARVLKPGGRYVFNVWRSLSENPFSQLADRVSASFFPGDPPGFYKVPFHYGDPEAVLADLREDDWSDVRYDTIRLTKKIADLDTFSRALVFGNPLIDEIRSRGGVDPEDVVAAMRTELEAQFGKDDITMPLSAMMFSCRAR